MEGIVTLQLSAKSVGMFEAFYNSLKPIQLVNTTVEVAPPGKLPDGTTEIPFEVFSPFLSLLQRIMCPVQLSRADSSAANPGAEPL
jgi:hypothetical protein